jgi:prepilin-type N-terminal cleavage/methylation domain-containing protein
MMWDATKQPDRRTAAGRCGFTLIELLAVISIVGIMSVTAIVAISGTDASRARAAARAVARDLTFARDRALATGRDTWVSFTVATSSYSVLVENPATPGRVGAVAIVDPATGASFVVRLGQRESAGVAIASVTVPGGGNDIGFDWLGRPENAAGTRLTSNATVALSNGVSVTVSAGAGLATSP